jgi:PAS domain-containing protein
MNMMRIVRQLMDVPSTDPDDQRRGRLLNILLLGIAALTLLAIVAMTIMSTSGGLVEPGPTLLYLGCLALLCGIAIIFAINRYRSSRLASSLFLLLVTLLLAFSDEPQEVADGRTLFAFAIPILMASVLLRPYASFIVASLVSLLIAAIGMTVQIVPNVFAMIVFFAIALVSWLSARSLERVLEDLRTINRELDQRVEQRTQELAEALGKNQAILEGIADGVIVFDNDGKAIVANPAITDLLERHADEIIGYDVETLIGAEVNADDQASIVALLRDRETRYPSVKFERGDKTLSMSAAPVCVAPEETIGTVAVFRDFTREAEIDRMKSAFVSMASHELRTPLNAILGYADMLQEGVYGPLPDKQHEVITRIIANAGELLSLASNLLDQAHSDQPGGQRHQIHQRGNGAHRRLPARRGPLDAGGVRHRLRHSSRSPTPHL